MMSARIASLCLTGAVLLILAMTHLSRYLVRDGSAEIGDHSEEISLRHATDSLEDCSDALSRDSCARVNGCSWCSSFSRGVQSMCVKTEQTALYANKTLFECDENSKSRKSNITQFYTGYHPQSLHNWENDPNGPMLYRGEYHLFLQYNPYGYEWGNMHWYHMKSKDLLHWEHLPIALSPDHKYDCDGIFSGSATIVNGKPVLTYSVSCGTVMVNAIPLNQNDSSLKNWTKPNYNPAIVRPETTAGFRDPTEGWKGDDGVWRMLTGCDDGACMFKSTDFINWTYNGIFWPTHVGFQECPDFYNLPGTDKNIYKGSAGGQDYWVLGEYKESTGIAEIDKFKNISSDIKFDARLYNRYDMGTFYASKTFYDTPNKRRVLFGYISFHCAGADWSGIQSVPREILLDPKKKNSILTYPIPEISTLRRTKSPVFEKQNTRLSPKSSIVHFGLGSQLDIQLKIKFDLNSDPNAVSQVHIRVLVDPDDPDAIYQLINLAWSRVGGPQLNGEPFEMHDSDNREVDVRVLVDRSVSETFVQGGRASFSDPYCTPSPKQLDGDVMGVTIYNAGEPTCDFEIVSLAVFQMKTVNVQPDIRA